MGKPIDGCLIASTHRGSVFTVGSMGVPTVIILVTAGCMAGLTVKES